MRLDLLPIAIENIEVDRLALSSKKNKLENENKIN
jgi:hypothetical protein